MELATHETFRNGNTVLFSRSSATPNDIHAETVSPYKTWRKMGSSCYRCPNCGCVPTCVDIRDYKICPKCQVIKTFYETDTGLMPMFESDWDGTLPESPFDEEFDDDEFEEEIEEDGELEHT